MSHQHLVGHFRDCNRFVRALVVAVSCVAVGMAPLLAETPEVHKPSRGVQLFQEHEFDKAATAFLADLSVDSNNVEALLYLGRIGFEENRMDAAAILFERVTVLAPKNAAGFLWLGRFYGVQARELGPPRGIGPAIRARRNLEKAVALDPNDLSARTDLATFYREAPGIVGGSKRAAVAQVEEITKRDPYLGALGRGDLALTEKKVDEAEHQYDAAVHLEPLKTDAYVRLGILHQRTRRYDQAFADFQKALQIDPHQKAACFQIGKTADLSGQRLDEGEAALKTYLQCKPFFMMPKLSWAYRRLGNIYLKKGSLQTAREQYLAALRMAPDDSEAVSALKQLDALVKSEARAPKSGVIPNP